MKKIKLFRNGRLVGLVNEDFHRTEKPIVNNDFWNHLGIKEL
jgi:hypothetical protein